MMTIDIGKYKYIDKRRFTVEGTLTEHGAQMRDELMFEAKAIADARRERKINMRLSARQKKNFVVLTLFKLLATKRACTKLNARKLRDIMVSNERWMTFCKKLGIVPVKRFFWENNALNTPKVCNHSLMPAGQYEADCFECGERITVNQPVEFVRWLKAEAN